MAYRIVTESTADLTPALCDRYRITVIPMHFVIDSVEYADDPANSALSPENFYQLLREGKSSTTAAVNLLQFQETFTPILEGGEDLLYLSFSSALSSTCASAFSAADELSARFPDRRIEVIDTRCASMGEGLLVCLAALRAQRGDPLEEVAVWLREEGAPRLQHWFTVDDLMHLYRGGRVGAVSAVVGGALGIKPILRVDAEGRLIPSAKARGRRAALLALAGKMAECGGASSDLPVFIGHADAQKDAETLARLITERFGPRPIEIAPVGPVIGSHTGPGTITLFFLGERR